MKIREAVTQDQERIVALFDQLGYSTEPSRFAGHLRELRQNDSGQALVAELDGVLLGVVIVHLMRPLHVEGAWALLSALVVDDKHRSVGVGRQLLMAAERFAIEKGCSQLELSSSVPRVQAHMFYERNGYQEKRLRFLKQFRHG